MGAEIALFPLGTVLVPGGLLPLRIFEARYVDMVSRCMRQNETFGVVLIKEGTETGRVAQTAAVGTTARIIDFQTLEDGLLGLLCRGETRFRIERRSQQGDGLNLASVEWNPDPNGVPIDPKYQSLVTVLRDALSRLSNLSQFIEPRYEDATWVSYRLAELLPLPVNLQQKLLEMNEPNERLELLAPLIEP
ncbi:MAG TPA: LON peptidase substrate-binding domain-containing protein [Steroidobacteraceae bacterium]|nr:LON peptidase substrate-binding domain-containing protein [Steroidobacteraceae bacterium]